MSSVTPPPPPTPPAAPPAPAPSVVVPQPSPALLALELGAKLDARILGADAQGRILIDTRVGQIAVQTNIPLPPSGPLQLQVQSLGNQVLLLITAIHGKAPAAALRSLSGLLPATLPGLGAQSGNPAKGPASAPGGTGSTATSGGAGTAATSNAAPVTLTEGATLKATLLRPGTAIPGRTGGGPAVSAGATGATARAGGLPGAAGNSAATPGTGGSPVSTGAPVQLPAGSAFVVRALAVQPPGGGGQVAPPGAAAPSGGALTLAPGLQLTGTVAASGGGNATVVQTHAGPASLATATALPPGSGVTLEVIEIQRPQMTAETAQLHQRLAHAISQSGQWPALDETLDTVNEFQPALVQQLVHAVLPRPDSTLAANLLFFLFALRGGEVRSWMGDAPARALEKIKPGLLGQLRDDFSGLARLTDDPPAGEARMTPIPLAHGGQIEQVKLWLNRLDEEDDDDADGRKGPGTRFVVDVTLSRLGRLQLDGFVQDGTKRFDLIVRSEHKLETQVQNGIRDIFEGAGEISGSKGGLAFQAAPPGFIDTEPQAPKTGLGLTV